MKKILMAMAVVFACLTSCQKMTNQNKQEEFSFTNSEIAFDANTTKNATKAIIEDDIMTMEFGAYGYVPTQSTYVTSQGGFGYIMKNGHYDENGDALDGPYYWPKSDNNTTVNVLFTAYAPYTANPSIDANGVVTVNAQTLTQGLIDNKAGFNELLYAQETANHQNTGAHVKVPLHFHHSMSRITFKAKIANVDEITEVEITSIKFNGGGLYTTGSIALDTKNEMLNPTTTYTTQNADLDFSGYKNSTAVALNKSTYTELSDALIVPQPVPESVTITFNVKITNTGGDAIKYFGREVTKLLNNHQDMSSTPKDYGTAYISSSRYIYNICVTVDGIDFDVDVIDWDNTTTEFQTWDATAYVEHFFDKASTMQGQSVVVTMAANSLMA